MLLILKHFHLISFPHKKILVPQGAVVKVCATETTAHRNPCFDSRDV